MHHAFMHVARACFFRLKIEIFLNWKVLGFSQIKFICVRVHKMQFNFIQDQQIDIQFYIRFCHPFFYATLYNLRIFCSLFRLHSVVVCQKRKICSKFRISQTTLKTSSAGRNVEMNNFRFKNKVFFEREVPFMCHTFGWIFKLKLIYNYVSCNRNLNWNSVIKFYYL